MDMFKEVLPKLDARDFQWAKDLSDDELKAAAPFIIMKFMSASSSKGFEEYHIMAVNEVVNKNFWEVSNHKKLQMMLLAACGTGKKQYHYFPGKSPKDTAKYKYLREKYPLWKADEIEMMMEKLSGSDMISLAKSFGMQDENLAKFEKELKNDGDL